MPQPALSHRHANAAPRAVTAPSWLSPKPFRCEVHNAVEGVVAVAPVGELDLQTAGEVRAALRDAPAPALAVVVLDLREVTFMDAAGVHLLFDMDAWAREAGVRLTIVPGPVARRLLEITGADRTLRLVDRPAGEGTGSGRDGFGSDRAAAAAASGRSVDPASRG
jgi:anti-sigma B factor antagonist